MTTTPTSSFRIQNSEFRIPRAFTLIEILVVVAIIIVLMAILLPALSSAKAAARKAETRALLSSLSTDCEAYFTVFNAYPGPAAAAQTTATSNKLSGTQNLLVGLSYSIRAIGDASPNITPAVPPSVTIPGAALVADPTQPTGVLDRSQTSPTGAFKQMAAFYSPAGKELSPSNGAATPAWPAGGIAGGGTGNSFDFPVILDRYPDALPILYYRKTPGVDGTATFDTTGNVSAQGTPPIVSNDPSTVASFYFNDNLEYTTSSTLASIAGVVFNQNVASPAAPSPAHIYNLNTTSGNVPANNLATEIAAQNGTNGTSHGGYVLISAGPDRLYGGGNKTDDLVQVGGS